MSLELGLRSNSRPLERPSTQVCKNIPLKNDLARNESGSDDVIRFEMRFANWKRCRNDEIGPTNVEQHSELSKTSYERNLFWKKVVALE